MSRTMDAEYAHAFRAVITTTTPAVPDSPYAFMRRERTRTEYAGPYAKIGPARAAITMAKRTADHYSGQVVTAYVERSSILWEKVPDDE